MNARPSLDPVCWTPPSDLGLTGAFTPTSPAAPLERWLMPGFGPEDVAVDAQGRLYVGTNDGQIFRVLNEGATIERVASTGGRPGGIEIDNDGSLVVCDMLRGLLRVDPESGAVTVLADAAQHRLTFTNNCAIAADGSVYFSDTSDKFPLAYFKGDLLEGRARGRLLRWSPNGSVDEVARDFRFANGVALAADDSFALVSETAGYRVSKVWLTGERAGSSDVVLDNIPGLPDNMSTGSEGTFWIAVPSGRNALLDRLLPLPGLFRKALWALPDRLHPEANRVVQVIGIDREGTVRHVLSSPGDTFHYVTGVRENEGWLYLGSLVENAIARIPAP